jgi:hypothetical protein
MAQVVENCIASTRPGTHTRVMIKVSCHSLPASGITDKSNIPLIPCLGPSLPDLLKAYYLPFITGSFSDIPLMCVAWTTVSFCDLSVWRLLLCFSGNFSYVTSLVVFSALFLLHLSGFLISSMLEFLHWFLNVLFSLRFCLFYFLFRESSITFLPVFLLFFFSYCILITRTLSVSFKNSIHGCIVLLYLWELLIVVFSVCIVSYFFILCLSNQGLPWLFIPHIETRVEVLVHEFIHS